MVHNKPLHAEPRAARVLKSTSFAAAGERCRYAASPMSESRLTFSLATMLVITACACVTFALWGNFGTCALPLGYAFAVGVVWSAAFSKSRMYQPLNQLTILELAVFTALMANLFILALPSRFAH